ncbi:hypothetical protein QQF64_035576 [Cirrhinus molitorella]|uniref:Uncharacterized protein n=1 Tax=Cirrhinus molitorella TaxID=172907 RepID=A0ABR3NG63_9TELE
MEITKQQSETARCQTELLEKVLLHSTPQVSTHCSRASSRHQSPRTQILQSVEKGQPKSEELSQALRKTQIRDTLFQSPPPVSRQTTLSSHQNRANPPSCLPSKVYLTHSQFASEAEPMPQTLHPVTTSQPRVDAVSYTPHLSSYWLPTVEGPTFPDFVKEDRAQYVELRITLDNLLHCQLPEHYKYSILLKHVKVPNAHRLVLAHAESLTPYTNALQAQEPTTYPCW